ncbi:MAG: hypothetical protein HQ549_03670 [Candidatus Omnitrophica bacterium]|nr:hypothetical protein [Candidatus Omnitrophota bacterium]
MLSKVIKITIALLFIPIAIAATRAFFGSLDSLAFVNINSFLLIGGFFAYPVFRIVFVKPTYFYALGHEVVHVLATWLCGGKVTSFHVSQRGGEVTTTKTNSFIRLSPYFVPIHAIFLSMVYAALFSILNLSRFFNEFLFLMGFTIGLHIFMTIETMKTSQPDIMKTGYFFSVLFIYVANIFVLISILSVISKQISFVNFVKNTFVLSKDIYLSFFGKLFT